MTDKTGVSIDKITLKIGETKVAVTMDQAKKLHAALSEMFGVKETVKHEYHNIYDKPWNWPWSRPFYSYGGSLSATNDLQGLADYKTMVGSTSELVKNPSPFELQSTSGNNFLLEIK